MFSFLIAVAIGAYASNRIKIAPNDVEGVFGIDIEWQQSWNDAIAFFELIGSVCFWLISTGREARNYFDIAVLPWLSDLGISVTLPVLELPTKAIVRGE